MMMRLLLALPIVFMPNALHFDYETGIPGLNIANLLVLVLVLGMLLMQRGPRPKPGMGPMTPPLLLLFAMLCMGFAITSMSPGASFLDDLTYLKNAVFYPLLYFIYRRSRQDLTGTRQLIILVMVVAAVAGVEAIREGLDYGIGRYTETRRASGPFGVDFHNANRAGVFYAMFLPMFVSMALFFRKQRLWRIAAIAGTAILSMAIMVTYSRQSYFIALAGCALLLLRRNVILAVLIGLCAVPAIALLPEGVTQRVADTEQTNAIGGEELDVSTASRFEIWGGALRMWQDHPLGVGLGRFKANIGRYVPAYAGYDTHNGFLRMLAEVGPLGLLAMLWVLWRALLIARLLRKSAAPNDAEAKAIAFGFAVLVVATGLGNLYGSPFFEGSVMANFWILCGLVEHYAGLKRNALAAPTDATIRAHQAQIPGIGQRFPLAARIAPGRYGRDDP